MKRLFSVLFLILITMVSCRFNRTPVINRAYLSRDSAYVGDTVYLICNAFDPDGDVLTYKWTAFEEGQIYETKDTAYRWIPTHKGTYKFQVRVEDEYGKSVSSDMYYINVNFGINLRDADSIGTVSIKLSWTPWPDTMWRSYEVWRSTIQDDIGEKVATMPLSMGFTRFDTLYTDEGLKPGQKYFYRIASIDIKGFSHVSNQIEIVTENFKNIGETDLSNGHGIKIVRQNNFSFVAAKESGVRVISVSGGNIGIVIPLVWDMNYAMDLSAQDTILAVAFYQGGIRLYDISNPAAPDTLVSYLLTTIGARPIQVLIDGTYMYLAMEDSLKPNHYLFRITKGIPGTLILGDTVGIASYVNDMVVNGNYLYLATEAGIEIIRAEDTHSVWLKRITTPSPVKGLYVSGSYLFAALKDHGLSIYDISSPYNISEVVNWQPTEGEADSYGVFVYGNYCYVADGKNGIRILDITDPHRPYSLYSYKIGSSLRNLWAGTDNVIGRVIHVVDYNNYFYLINW